MMQPGRFTELFILDEATAFAAGHRPCALCRREDYGRFVEIWRDLHPGPSGADRVDARLHAERIDPTTRTQRHHEERFASLPEGAMVIVDGVAFLVAGNSLQRWTPADTTARTRNLAPESPRWMTPPSLVEVLRRGWDPAVPLLHPSTG